MKKFGKVLAVIFVLLLVLVIAQVATYDESKNAAEVMIEAPASAVYPYITEPEKLMKWIDGFKESTPLTDPELAIGARSKEKIVVDGQDYFMETEVLDFRVNELLTVSITNEAFYSKAVYTLNETEGKTILSLDQTSQYKTFMGKLFASLITTLAQDKLNSDMEKLKKLVEKEQRSIITAEPELLEPEMVDDMEEEKDMKEEGGE